MCNSERVNRVRTSYVLNVNNRELWDRHDRSRHAATLAGVDDHTGSRLFDVPRWRVDNESGDTHALTSLNDHPFGVRTMIASSTVTSRTVNI